MRQCGQCGRQFDSADRFCQFCGVELTEVAAAPTPAAPAPVVAAPGVSAPPVVAKAAPPVVVAPNLAPAPRQAPVVASSAIPATAPAIPAPSTAPAFAGWNGFAIASVVLLVFGITVVSIPLGHLALRQIATTRQRGRRLAIGALVLSYLVLLFWVILTIVGAASSAQR